MPPETPPPPPDWLPEWLASVWNLLAVEPVLLALVVLLVGVLLAVIARGVIVSWGGKLTARTNTDVDDQLLRLLGRIVATALVYVSAIVAVEVLPFGDSVTTMLQRVVLSFLILQVTREALRASGLALAVLSRLRHRFRVVEERTIPLFHIVLTIVIVGVAGYALLRVWNIDATAWLASAGVAGIAIGFAAKDTIANLFAGFFIIADAPYKVGDFVVLDSGERGEVTHVGIRSTRMLTRDDVEIIVPNSEMANKKIVNESGGRWVKFRLRVPVGVAYGSDVDRVTAVLERVGREHTSVCDDPAPRARFRRFGDSSLDFELLAWIEQPSEQGLVRHELNMAIYKAFAAEGIQIPFPQRDVWLRQSP